MLYNESIDLAEVKREVKLGRLLFEHKQVCRASWVRRNGVCHPTGNHLVDQLGQKLALLLRLIS